MLNSRPEDPGFAKIQAFGRWLCDRRNTAFLKSLMFMLNNLTPQPSQGVTEGIVTSIKSLSLRNVETLLKLDLEHAVCCDNDGMLRATFLLLNTPSMAHRAACIIKELVADGDKKVRRELTRRASCAGCSRRCSTSGRRTSSPPKTGTEARHQL